MRPTIAQPTAESLSLPHGFRFRCFPRTYLQTSAFFCCFSLVFSVLPLSGLAVELRDSDQVSLHPTEPTEITLTGQNLRSESGQVADLWCSSPV
ncbi:MAG: hypothetical protein ACPHJ3_08610, partial [Rubripirellula sp.]